MPRTHRPVCPYPKAMQVTAKINLGVALQLLKWYGIHEQEYADCNMTEKELSIVLWDGCTDNDFETKRDHYKYLNNALMLHAFEAEEIKIERIGCAGMITKICKPDETNMNIKALRGLASAAGHYGGVLGMQKKNPETVTINIHEQFGMKLISTAQKMNVGTADIKLLVNDFAREVVRQEQIAGKSKSEIKKLLTEGLLDQFNSNKDIKQIDNKLKDDYSKACHKHEEEDKV